MHRDRASLAPASDMHPILDRRAAARRQRMKEPAHQRFSCDVVLDRDATAGESDAARACHRTGCTDICVPGAKSAVFGRPDGPRAVRCGVRYALGRLETKKLV